MDWFKSKIDEVARLRAEREDLARKVAFYEESLCLDAGPMRALYGGGVTREIAPEKVYAILDERATLRAEVERLKAHELDVAKCATDLLGCDLCAVHSEEARTMPFPEFAANMKASGCRECNRAQLTRLQSEKSAAVEAVGVVVKALRSGPVHTDYQGWCAALANDLAAVIHKTEADGS